MPMFLMFVTCNDSGSRVFLDSSGNLGHLDDDTPCHSQEFTCHHDEVIPADLAILIVKMMGVVK